MLEARRLFSIADRYAYLDHAAMGPQPAPVVAAQQRFLATQAARGSLASEAFRTARERLRSAMASFIGASPLEIGLTKNTPEGLSIVAAGLDWADGDNVVSCDLEFPANIYPWLNLNQRGVQLRLVRSQNGRVPIEALLQAVDRRTRLLTISYVQFSTGFRTELARLSEFCRPRGVLLVADVMQALGALPIDVDSLGVDVLAGASHKWLLGPFGMGWLYCRSDVVESIRPIQVGEGSMLERASYLDYASELRPGAARYESGAINQGGVDGLLAAIELLTSTGQHVIFEQILALNDRLIAGLQQAGYSVVSSLEPAERSGILAFRHPRVCSAQLHRRLQEADVVVSLREGLLRASPHFYNSVDDVDRLLAALPRT